MAELISVESSCNQEYKTMTTGVSKVEERIRQKIYQLNPYRQKSNFKTREIAMRWFCQCEYGGLLGCKCMNTVMSYNEWLYWTKPQIQIISQRSDCKRCANAVFITYIGQFRNRLSTTVEYYYTISEGIWYYHGQCSFHDRLCMHNDLTSAESSLSDGTHSKKLLGYIQLLYDEYKNAEMVDRVEIVSKAMILSDYLTIDVAKVICSMLYYL